MTFPKPGKATSLLLLQEPLPLLNALRDLFHSHSVETYLVGGFLRDALLGRPSRDLDLAVQGDAISLARELSGRMKGSLVPLGEAHAIARVVLPEREGQGRWQVDLAPFAGEIALDLARRDFTVDAMALSLDDALGDSPMEGLIDPSGGLSDLAGAVIRVVSGRAFQDDPVRLLRGVRLAAQLGFFLEPGTRSLIMRDAHLLSIVAPERLRDELLKTLAEEGASRHLRLMDALGLLCRLVPELESARDVAQPKEHYWDVLQHSLEAAGEVERVTREDGRAGDRVLSQIPWHASLEAHFEEEVSDGHTRRTLIKLAGLLHDIAKPVTKTIEPSGRMRFFGHDVQGARTSEEVLRRMRLSGRGVRLVSTMIEHHLRPTQMSQNVEMPTRRAIYRYFRDVGEAAIDTLYLNLADYLAAMGPRVRQGDWEGHCRLIGYILHQGLEEQTAPERIPRLVDGHALMMALGLSPGPQVGHLLDAIREAQGAGEVASQEGAIELARRLLRAEGQDGSTKRQ